MKKEMINTANFRATVTICVISFAIIRVIKKYTR